MVKDIKYLVISDLHIGKGNLTKLLISNLYKYLKNPIFINLDILYLAGDTFDKLLATNSIEYNEGMRFLSWLVTYCSKHNIKLRILEGTASHDWRQVNALYNIISNLEVDVDFKYITDVTIEYFKEYNLHTLYIPDNINVDATFTYKYVLKYMKDNHIHRIDNAIIHGQFHYQLPIMSISSHTESDYLRIVCDYIHTGHIHTSKIYKRIIGNGSLDRLSHGEEEPKGGYYVTYKDGIPSFKVIKNNNAIIFKTIDISNREILSIYKKLDKIIYKYVKGSHIRIRLTKNNSLIKDIEKDIKKKYVDYVIKVDKEVVKIKEEEIDKIEELSILEITEHNIIEVICNELPDNVNVDDILTELKQVM